MESILKSLALLKPYVSQEMAMLITIILVVASIVWLAFRLKSKYDDREERVAEFVKGSGERLTVLELRQSKLMGQILDCPGLTRDNIRWLKKDEDTSVTPPDQHLCANNLKNKQERK